jgi:CheY-like chemotaxis protein
VVADADPERAKRTATALMEAGLEIVLAHDGVEAILAVQRVLPRAVVLDAALPKMFGFQVCELMKRNESLRSVLVLLVGSTHHPDRYRRAPSDLYGADSYLEDTDLPGGVLRALAGLGVEFDRSRPATRAAGDSSPRPGGGAETSAPTGRLDAVDRAGPDPPPPTPALRPTPTPRPVSEPEPEAARPIAAATTSEAARGVAEAERLARIIVSDIVLYNEEKFVRAVREGNVLEVLGPELEEGRALFRGRIEASVRELGDFLEQELLRVARARGME